jgi:hypothetical protein
MRSASGNVYANRYIGKTKTDLATSGKVRHGRKGGNHSSPCLVAPNLGQLIEGNKLDLSTAVGLLVFMPSGVYPTA